MSRCPECGTEHGCVCDYDAPTNKPSAPVEGAGLDEIPREHLISMLLDAAWYSGERPNYESQGYSFDVDEETSYRDVNYRDEPLYPSPQEALLAHWERHYQKNPKTADD